MKNLSHKIELYLGRTPNFREEVKLQDDGDGAYISFWSDSVEKSKPTDEQLNAFESEATKLENNNKIRATRKSLYGDIGDQLDEIFKDIESWKARIQKIKDDNPKESS
jgi:hypothetical protein|tara:strand:- start:185 stop:508 length:324 start_codon:yes stop_codon:yes gene_type:complete